MTGFDVAKDIQSAFLGLFGEEDKNQAPDDVRNFEAPLKPHNQKIEMIIYPDARHAFHADYRQKPPRGGKRRGCVVSGVQAPSECVRLLSEDG